MSAKPLNMEKDISSFFPERDIETAKKEAEVFAGPEEDLPAKYKIEIMFSRHRSSLGHKPSTALILIWESGKKLHGGGDNRMYWCGYEDCDSPISTDLFGLYSVVCPHCGRECFLDDGGKAMHAKRSNDRSIDSMPVVYGERGVHLVPSDMATIIERIWHSLDNNADILIKYSPYDIRMDPGNLTPADIEMLAKTRGAREVASYPIRSIIRDITAGADIKKRIIGFITA